MNFSHLTIKGGVKPPGGGFVVGHFDAPEYTIRAEGPWVLVSKGEDTIAVPVGQCVVGVVAKPKRKPAMPENPMRRGNRGGDLKYHAEQCKCVRCEEFDKGLPRQPSEAGGLLRPVMSREGAMPPGASCDGCGDATYGKPTGLKSQMAVDIAAELAPRLCLICKGPMTGKPPEQKTCGRSCGAKWRAQRGKS